MVYVFAELVIEDRDAYERYASRFLDVFERYAGEVLVVEEEPRVLEGAWPYTRAVLLRFPSGAEAQRWYESDEYREIERARHEGARANVVLLRALPDRRGSAGAADR